MDVGIATGVETDLEAVAEDGPGGVVSKELEARGASAGLVHIKALVGIKRPYSDISMEGSGHPGLTIGAQHQEAVFLVGQVGKLVVVRSDSKTVCRRASNRVIGQLHVAVGISPMPVYVKLTNGLVLVDPNLSIGSYCEGGKGSRTKVERPILHVHEMGIHSIFPHR
jgi:hypothetical protein